MVLVFQRADFSRIRKITREIHQKVNINVNRSFNIFITKKDDNCD